MAGRGGQPAHPGGMRIPPFGSRIARSLIVLGLSAACMSATGPKLVGSGPAILFIGNSYTCENDIPGMVAALAKAAGSPVAVEMIAEPNYALIDHWKGGSSARPEIARREWKYVVLQQGPSSVEINRDSLRLTAKLFDAAIRKSGGTPALFSAWPMQSRRVDFPRAIESYRLAAQDVGGVFLPVAGAWLAAWDRDPTIALYADDGLHASTAGSYLAALVIFSALTNQSPVGAPARFTLEGGGQVDIEPRLAAILQQAAAAAREL
jgi:hypothetical protein